MAYILWRYIDKNSLSTNDFDGLSYFKYTAIFRRSIDSGDPDFIPINTHGRVQGNNVSLPNSSGVYCFNTSTISNVHILCFSLNWNICVLTIRIYMYVSATIAMLVYLVRRYFFFDYKREAVFVGLSLCYHLHSSKRQTWPHRTRPRWLCLA